MGSKKVYIKLSSDGSSDEELKPCGCYCGSASSDSSGSASSDSSDSASSDSSDSSSSEEVLELPKPQLVKRGKKNILSPSFDCTSA
jgi:hypothetical protein